jgi:transposase
MIRQWIQNTRNMVFEPALLSNTTSRRIHSQIDVDRSGQPILVNRKTDEQQRIRLLEIQNQQLRSDVEMWKKASISLARELRELLTD